jgi:hypothetical protein
MTTTRVRAHATIESRAPLIAPRLAACLTSPAPPGLDEHCRQHTRVVPQRTAARVHDGVLFKFSPDCVWGRLWVSLDTDAFFASPNHCFPP